MMKRHNILTVLGVLLLTFAACDKNSAPGFSFTTDSILTLTFDKELDAAFVGVGTQNYNPVGMRRSGDTLFIANRAEGSDGVWVVRASTGELLYSLTGWTYNGKNEKFDNQVMDVAVSSELHLCGEPFVPDRPVPTERLFVCDHHRAYRMAVEFSVAMRSGRSGR